MGQVHSSAVRAKQQGEALSTRQLFKRLVSKKSKAHKGASHECLAAALTTVTDADHDSQTRSTADAQAGVVGVTVTAPSSKPASPDHPQEHKYQRSDSASSNHAAAFVNWAKNQSSSKQMTMQQFLQEQCSNVVNTTDSSRMSFDTMSLAEILAAAELASCSRTKAAPTSYKQQQVQLAPFAPHNGWLSGPPKPACHEARIAAADGINALRTTRDGEIESMLRLMCKVFDVETATVALLTGEAIYITGACGALNACICPDRWGFCGWSFINSHHELLVVEDMDKDARFSENFFVIEPTFSLKFYVAAPLITANGHRLGTLCVMGQQPRKFDALKGQLLANLAEMLVRQLEEKWVASLQESCSATQLRRSLSCYSACYLVLDLSANPWRILHMNEPARSATGVDWTASYAELPDYSAGRREKQPFDGMPLTALFDMSSASILWSGASSSSSPDKSSSSSNTWEFRLSGLKPSPDAPEALHHAVVASRHSSYSLRCRLAIADGLDESQPFYIGVPAWLALSENNTWGRNYFFARLEVEEADGMLREVAPQQQQLQAQLPFAGDSVEQLMKTTSAAFAQQQLGCAAHISAAISIGQASIDSSSSSAALTGWLPRGLSGVSDVSATIDNSSSSNICSSGITPNTPSAASSVPSNSHFLGSAGCVTSVASSVKSVTSVTASSQMEKVVCRGLPVPGLVMGPLVGRGSYGRVYRGILKGHPVAVKIIDDINSLRMANSGEPLEVSLTRDLKHMGVMATLGYTYSDAAAVPSTTTVAAARGGGSAVRGAAAGGGGGAGGRGGRSAMRAGGGRVCWMLFEYCDKGVLADGVLRGWFRTVPNPLAGAPHLRVIGLTALEIAVAMKYLHDQGILHGDLCGGNVMLSKSSTNPHGFTAKVGDFGLARINSSSSDTAHPVDQRLANNAYGTITHMSPEVLLDGGAAFTPAADVYSWGVLLWEMISGSRAWAGLAAPAVVVQVAVLNRGLAMPNNLPEVLDDLLRRALSPQPKARPSFSEIVEGLTKFVQQSRAVDWEKWQADVEAAHAEQRAAAKAAAAAGKGASTGDAAQCPAVCPAAVVAA